MTDWPSGYVTDLGYTFGFYRELTPEMIRFVTLVAGTADKEPISTYCELGCGQGFATNLLAAANPGISFYATDFNPSQIAGAQRLAKTAGITNVHFFDQSFGDFINEPSLPSKFDVIVLHGIYSWVNADVRSEIVRFLDTRLKPGGIVYISYNTLPGWAAPGPMRHLMYLHSEHSEAKATLDRIEPAMNFLREISAAGASFFKSVPGLNERLEKLTGQNKHYVAHEYLNSAWTAFYHDQVAQELSNARLGYIGSANLLDHIEAINLTEEQRKLLAQVPDATFRQVVKDYMTNQQFRRDIFARGSVALLPLEARDLWLNQRFALSTRGEDIPMKVTGAMGDATMQEDVYGPILSVLREGAATARALLANADVAKLGWNRLHQALIVLCGAGHLQPCPEPAGEGARRKSTRPFNLAVMERARHSADLQYLASPVTGGGIAVNRFEQLFLVALGERHADPAAFVWKILDSQGQRVAKDNKALMSAQENIDELKARYDDFAEKRLPVLKQLGIA